ncbi:IS5 family transposase [Chromobacterium violaceum]|uniref:Transposase DDE domain n=1 Tax=Chromobacterium violaceum TaxID=536 RepID=A0AAX2M7Q8_CHRVL|nr:IS5 family transposase [Chromobacterium violaceum]STB63925.1 Transposase DDE domain [Chromobacterium violaceum]STB63977.1 Transposase DDE domain [Chromobacterium violaceum]STB64173.1 Transposase DDE domain [Chromobacterium violaceum]STB69484.1 Transposase DDE domain [Chromobacterium violaceum]SUX32053.1 Transposase DDE domain [Chromobacterium violaceum]
MTKPAPKRYRTTNWNAYNQALIQRGSLSVWLDTSMSWQAAPRGKRGRTQTYSDAAIQFCLTIKNLFGLALRQTIGFIQSLLKLAGLGWGVPDYSTLSRRQQTLQVKIPYQKSSGALHLLVDSTGIKMLGEGEWKTKKHGAEYRRQWRKVHLGIDAETLQIRAIEVTDNRQGDAQMLPSLLTQIPADEPIGCVSGDGAFDTKTCHEAIAARGAIGCIRTRKNARPWKGNSLGVLARNEILRATKRLGRAIWKRWSGYHRRSLVETKMGCFKRLGERVTARRFDSQVAELQVRAAILNRFSMLGRPCTVAVA